MREEQKRLYIETVDNNIEKHGYHVTYVLEEQDFTPFGYSSGLYKNFGIPEAFVSGLPNGLTNTLITNYAQAFRNRKVPLNQKLDNLIDRFPVYIIPVKNEAVNEKILNTFRFYENDYFESVQILFPDLNGKFSGETGYDYDQEIFGNTN
ncbi:DUF4262 domain-containing protein [Pedobacter sp. PF22-3]|uniref:DUF4262 domain-containing protein n=1 Tax=Pedobacter sp. PF22-3 TaxID=2994467 RepID=UPI00224570BB|nr:DUF4262 domain-containing protein [Pedobacter sp. PF22-3]MCX2496141.1 DUF4262 domain-containing protein [Pedobacter sp. PF22-3]